MKKRHAKFAAGILACAVTGIGAQIALAGLPLPVGEAEAPQLGAVSVLPPGEGPEHLGFATRAEPDSGKLGHEVASAADTLTADRQIDCMAKVIVHEAGNQPRVGQIAVAQVIRARIRDGRFGADACSVAKQRGQFFDIMAYEPARTDARWATAIAIAKETLSGAGEDVVPGALFFHSASAAMPGRVRLAQVADHVFYR